VRRLFATAHMVTTMGASHAVGAADVVGDGVDAGQAAQPQRRGWFIVVKARCRQSSAAVAWWWCYCVAATTWLAPS
jgi:hypothetical protein